VVGVSSIALLFSPSAPPLDDRPNPTDQRYEKTYTQAFNEGEIPLTGIDVVTMVPDLDDLAVFESKHIDNGNLIASTHDFEEKRCRLHLPLPTRRYQITLGDLVVNTSGHISVRVKEVGDVFLLNRLFNDAFPIAGIMDGVFIGDVFGIPVRIVCKPEVFIEGPGDRLIGSLK